MTNTQTNLWHITWRGYDHNLELIESDDCDDFYIHAYSQEDAERTVLNELRGELDGIELECRRLDRGDVEQYHGTVLGKWMAAVVRDDSQRRVH